MKAATSRKVRVKYVVGVGERISSGGSMRFAYCGDNRPMHLTNLLGTAHGPITDSVAICGEKLKAYATGSWAERGKVCDKCLTISKL